MRRDVHDFQSVNVGGSSSRFAGGIFEVKLDWRSVHVVLVAEVARVVVGVVDDGRHVAARVDAPNAIFSLFVTVTKQECVLIDEHAHWDTGSVEPVEEVLHVLVEISEVGVIFVLLAHLQDALGHRLHDAAVAC